MASSKRDQEFKARRLGPLWAALGAALALLAAWPKAGWAQAPSPAYSFTLKQDAAGNLACVKSSGDGPKAGAPSMVIAWERDSNVTVAAGSSFELLGCIGSICSLDGQTPVATVPLSQFGTFRVDLDAPPPANRLAPGQSIRARFMIAGGAPQGVPCEPVEGFSNGPKPADTSARQKLDQRAYKWLHSAYGDNAVKVLEDRFKNEKKKKLSLLVHLPSGAPAPPSASSFRENTPLQAVIIVPTEGFEDSVGLSVTTCEGTQAFRVKPSTPAGPAAVATKHSGPFTRDEFFLFPIGRWFKCGAGVANYDLNFGSGEGEQTVPSKLRMRPVHHLAATVVVGYDWGREVGYETRAGLDAAGNAIATVDDYKQPVGIAAYVGATWMVGGVDYEHKRPWNYFGNVFVAVDPQAPTKHAVAGLAITPTGGISLALGVGLHKGQTLRGYEVGQRFEGDGEIPTRETWKGVRAGPFIGVTLDSNVYEALKTKLDGGN